MRFAVIVFISVILTSCGIKYHDSISGNGKVIETTISSDTIRRIKVSDKLDVTLIPSDTNRVILKADENLHDIIKISIERGVMRISVEKYIRIARSKEILVYGRNICEVDASAKSTVISQDTLCCNELTLVATSGSDIRIAGHFNSLIVNCSSGSNIFLEGKTDYLNINANSAADIYGYDFSANNSDILATSASDVRVTIKDEAHFNVSSAADIIYKGNPAIIDSKTSSLGEVRRARF